MRQTVEYSARTGACNPTEPCPGQLPVTVAAGSDGAPAIRVDHDRVRLTWCDGSRDFVRIVPVADYTGIVISVEQDEIGEVAHVSLRHADRSFDVLLHSAREDHEISDLMRAWAIWADCLDVPRLVEMADGSLEHVPHSAGRRPMPRRAAPRRVNRHFRSHRPNVMGGLVPGARVAGVEIIARR